MGVRTTERRGTYLQVNMHRIAPLKFPINIHSTVSIVTSHLFLKNTLTLKPMKDLRFHKINYTWLKPADMAKSLEAETKFSI